MTDIKPSNGIHLTDLALMKRLITRYGPQLTLRGLAAVCDDHAVQIASTDAADAKSWLAMSALLDEIAAELEQGE
jgi:hypothetical protein